jgi:hypothetical protein
MESLLRLLLCTEVYPLSSRIQPGCSQFQRCTLVTWPGIPLCYSELAFIYLWRVTGGHPALAQLICAKVVSEWRHKGCSLEVIPLTLIQKVVRDLVEDTDLLGYYRYIYRYSIPESSRETFEQLVRERRVDPVTLRVRHDGLSSKDLLRLKRQQIIRSGPSENGSTWFLRLGFFYLWLESWPTWEK